MKDQHTVGAAITALPNRLPNVENAKITINAAGVNHREASRQEVPIVWIHDERYCVTGRYGFFTKLPNQTSVTGMFAGLELPCPCSL